MCLQLVVLSDTHGPYFRLGKRPDRPVTDRRNLKIVGTTKTPIGLPLKHTDKTQKPYRTPTESPNTNIHKTSGIMELVAFVACWHSAGSGCEKATHHTVQPSAASQKVGLPDSGLVVP